MKIVRGIPVIFGYDYDNVLGRAEIIVHEDNSSTITIKCPSSAKALPEILADNILIGLAFINKPAPQEEI